MTFFEYTNDDVINDVKKKLEAITGVAYYDLLIVSNELKQIYNVYKTKFDYNTYINRYNEIYYESKTPDLLSEKYIKRLSIINKLSDGVEKGNKIYNEVVFFMGLAYIINWKLVDLKALWNMEYERCNNLFITDFDDIIYDYYRLFIFIYLDITESLINDFGEHFSDSSTTSYKKNINMLLTKIKNN